MCVLMLRYFEGWTEKTRRLPEHRTHLKLWRNSTRFQSDNVPQRNIKTSRAVLVFKLYRT